MKKISKVDFLYGLSLFFTFIVSIYSYRITSDLRQSFEDTVESQKRQKRIYQLKDLINKIQNQIDSQQDFNPITNYNHIFSDEYNEVLNKNAKDKIELIKIFYQNKDHTNVKYNLIQLDDILQNEISQDQDIFSKSIATFFKHVQLNANLAGNFSSIMSLFIISFFLIRMKKIHQEDKFSIFNENNLDSFKILFDQKADHINIKILNSGKDIDVHLLRLLISEVFNTNEINHMMNIDFNSSRSFVESMGGTIEINHHTPLTSIEIYLPVQSKKLLKSA